MKAKRKLVILHIDGLSYHRFKKALAAGYMPAVKEIIKKERYKIIPYRTGIPSTTPYAQAGILYGDNHNIPSFTWFDKQSGVLVRFGAYATFKKVAHKYFHKNKPITKDGASIAACYPAGAAETFALAYNDIRSGTKTTKKSRRKVLIRWLLNPLHIIDWLQYTLIMFFAYLDMFIRTEVSGNNVAMKYFFTNFLQEIFLHHMTRYAVVQAMNDNYNVIYAAFYAYDDGAHALGPSDPFSFIILRQLNNSINYINKKRLKNKAKYELVILSDHGQVPAIPFTKQQKKHLGDIISEWYPTYDISETPGKHIKPRSHAQDGEIVLTYCGGIGHLYLRNIHGRIGQAKIEKTIPGLIDKLISLPEIGSILMKKGKRDVLLTKNKTFTLTKKITPALKKYLKSYDEPDILLHQLKELNTFDKAGDLIFFGAFINRKQINFENQFGGHGAFGGEQMHPFIMLKKEWQIPANQINNSKEIYHVLKNIIKADNTVFGLN